MERQTIEANGINFSYYEMGQGPLLLLLHGFPDVAETWLEVMPAFSRHHRVIAPNLRGYAPTSVPTNHSYHAVDLGGDVLALIDAFGAEKAIVVGHDWGALSAYAATSMAPEKVERLVTVAVPHSRAIKPSFKLLWQARHMINFQRKKSSINWLKKDNFQAINTIFRRWSPNWDVQESDLTAIKQSFAQPGTVEASLGYYWWMAKTINDKEIRQKTARRISVPSLFIAGEADGALPIELVPHTVDGYTGYYRYEIMPDVGHFLHNEAPEAFTKLVLDFLVEPIG